MTLKVAFHPRARTDLFDLYDSIEERGGASAAGRYLDRIEALCMSLSRFPQRGLDRGDLAPGVRTLTLERRVLVAYRVDGNGVEILRILYAGRDYAADDLPP